MIRNQFSPEPTWPKKPIVELLRASKRAAYWVTSQLPLCCPEKDAFDPAWQFLDSAGQPPLPERRRAINLASFCDTIA